MIHEPLYNRHLYVRTLRVWYTLSGLDEQVHPSRALHFDKYARSCFTFEREQPRSNKFTRDLSR